MGYQKGMGVWKVSRKNRRRNKKRTLRQMEEHLNDQSHKARLASRDFFKDADIGTRRHKVKKKYTRKPKYKKNWEDEE